MWSRDDLIQREQQELEAALRETDVQARRRRLEMANAYTSRIEDINRQEQIPPESFQSSEADGILLER